MFSFIFYKGYLNWHANIELPTCGDCELLVYILFFIKGLVALANIAYAT